MTIDKILFERSVDMLPSAWMAYDAEGRCRACGEGGTGGALILGDERVTRIVCGTTLYDFIVAHVAEGETA